MVVSNQQSAATYDERKGNKKFSASKGAMQVEFGVDMVGFKSRVNILPVIRIITRAAMFCVCLS